MLPEIDGAVIETELNPRVAGLIVAVTEVFNNRRPERHTELRRRRFRNSNCNL
jgi:hypothetical protein